MLLAFNFSFKLCWFYALDVSKIGIYCGFLRAQRCLFILAGYVPEYNTAQHE